jgi:hypothetical protein
LKRGQNEIGRPAKKDREEEVRLLLLRSPQNFDAHKVISCSQQAKSLEAGSELEKMAELFLATRSFAPFWVGRGHVLAVRISRCGGAGQGVTDREASIACCAGR